MLNAKYVHKVNKLMTISRELAEGENISRWHLSAPETIVVVNTAKIYMKKGTDRE